METLKQDIIFSLRMMKKQPGFTAAAVLALTLGIGANAVIFSMINSVLLRSLPVQEPDRLVSMLLTNEHGTMNNFSYSDYQNYRDKSGVFSGIFGHSMINAGLSNSGVESELRYE